MDAKREKLVVEKAETEMRAALAALALERHDLERDREYLRRRIDEEDARLARE